MIFEETALKGAYIIHPEKLEDDRGFFARVWCENEFEAHGLSTSMVQSNLSFNHNKGTLRGMHFQIFPYEEVKLVRCTLGVIYDVIIDLRNDSPTFMKWTGVELSADNHRMLYVPEGFAHGYQTLADRSEVFYQVSQFYTPNSESGVRWNDSAFNIEWPETAVRTISEKDQKWPDYRGEKPDNQ